MRALLLASLLVACTPEAGSTLAGSSLSALVGPGQVAAVAAGLSRGAVEQVDPTPVLSSSAEQAVAAAPRWIRDPLRLRLSMLDEPTQDTLAGLILDAPRDELVDEIAFSVANLSEQDPGQDDFDPSVIWENAEEILEAADLVDYAELVDTGTGPADRATTIRYSIEDGEGNPLTFELPRDEYYWWVVHPKLDFEDLVPVDPATGRPAPAPEGVHWRLYALDSSGETFDYRDHFLLREPVDLTGQDLSIGASAHLVGPEIYPLRILVDGEGEGVLVEADLGAGTLLASTADLLGAWRDGLQGVLVNLACYGDTNVLLRSYERVALLEDGSPPEDDPYVQALAEVGVEPEAVGPSDLGDLDLSGFDKVIVAADQSLELYRAVASRSEDLEQWVSDGGTLELDLHSGADLSSLALPGGTSVAGSPPGQVLVEGQPRLRDYVQGSSLLWDGVPYEGLSGDRAPDPGGMAMEEIGWVVSQDMFDNVAEYMEATGETDPERTQYPQRILHNHYGNCGELGDLMGAMGRAALLPVRVIESVEDHCWNEVWIDGRWVPWQVDWSDGATRIDNPGVAYDEDQGGGKTLSGVWTVRGDGYALNVPEPYTETVTADFTVTDAGGRPEDGALVLLATESYYDPSQLTVAAVTWTDPSGHASIEVGDSRNYWYYVRGPGGAESPSDGDPDRITVDSLAGAGDTEPGAVITREVVLDELLPAPAASDVSPGGEASADLFGSVGSTWTVAEGFYYPYGHFIHEEQGGALRWFLLDRPDFEAMLAGQDFEALAEADDVSEIDLAGVAVPAGRRLYLAAVNTSSTLWARVDLSLSLGPGG